MIKAKSLELEIVNFPPKEEIIRMKLKMPDDIPLSWFFQTIVQLYILNKETKEIKKAVMILPYSDEKFQRYHFGILKAYLEHNNLNFSIKTDGSGIFNIPNIKGDEYKITGMGKIKIHLINKQIKEPCSYSDDYDIEPDKDFNPLIKKKIEELGWTISD